MIFININIKGAVSVSKRLKIIKIMNTLEHSSPSSMLRNAFALLAFITSTIVMHIMSFFTNKCNILGRKVDSKNISAENMFFSHRIITAPRKISQKCFPSLDHRLARKLAYETGHSKATFLKKPAVLFEILMKNFPLNNGKSNQKLIDLIAEAGSCSARRFLTQKHE